MTKVELELTSRRLFSLSTNEAWHGMRLKHDILLQLGRFDFPITPITISDVSLSLKSFLDLCGKQFLKEISE